MARRAMTSLMVLALVAGTALGGTAVQYRGPENEAPRGIAPPSVDGPIGSERLASKSRLVEGLTRWEFWWEMNRDRFLRRAAGRNVATFSGNVVLSMWAGEDKGPAWVDEADVRMRIVRTLLDRLQSKDQEERALAAIALGKSRVSAAFGPLKELFDRGSPEDRRAAAVALGLLGEPLAVPVLSGFVGRAGVPAGDRAYAALALGLLGAPEGVRVLERVLAESMSFRGRGVEELQVAAATSLGLLGSDTSTALLGRLAGARNGVPDELRAASIIALGRIDSDRAFPVLVAALKAKDVDVRRAAAEALGLSKREDARGPLLAAFLDDSDVSVRNFAAMSLARIGGPNVANALVSGLHRSNPTALRGFSALALGVLGDNTRVDELRKLVQKPDEKSLAGAAAVALGLIGDPGAIPFLRQVARDVTKDDDLRGYATLALAMLGDRTTLMSLSRTVSEENAADLRRASALSVGMAVRMRSGPTILRALFMDSDPRVRGAAVSSLALVPRQSVLGTLIDVAEGAGYARDARLDAVSALGVLAARGRPSRIEDVLDGMHYRSMTEALDYLTRLL